MPNKDKYEPFYLLSPPKGEVEQPRRDYLKKLDALVQTSQVRSARYETLEDLALLTKSAQDFQAFLDFLRIHPRRHTDWVKASIAWAEKGLAEAQKS